MGSRLDAAEWVSDVMEENPQDCIHTVELGEPSGGGVLDQHAQSPGFDPQYFLKLVIVLNTYKSSTRVVEKGGSEVQSHP